MNLKRKLRELEPDQKIKVGTGDSSAYFYVGTAGDMLKNMQAYNAYCKLYSERCRRRAENNLKNALDRWFSPAEYAKVETTTSKPVLTSDGYLKALDMWFKNVERLSEAKKIREQRDDEYVKLDEREVAVAEMSDPTVDYGVMKIIIRGHELGKYWITCEAKKLPSCSFGNDDHREDEDDG